MSIYLMRTALFLFISSSSLLFSAQLTDPLRNQQEALKDQLLKLNQNVADLSTLQPLDQTASMQKIALALQTNIRPHENWEAAVLYPAVDQIVGGVYSFTATLAYDQIIINRWIDDLALLAARTNIDILTFQRRAFFIFGLLTAHIEEVEQILFSVIDKNMTPQQFQTQIMNNSVISSPK